jgi:hypothetical protein
MTGAHRFRSEGHNCLASSRAAYGRVDACGSTAVPRARAANLTSRSKWATLLEEGALARGRVTAAQGGRAREQRRAVARARFQRLLRWPAPKVRMEPLIGIRSAPKESGKAPVADVALQGLVILASFPPSAFPPWMSRATGRSSSCDRRTRSLPARAGAERA